MHHFVCWCCVCVDPGVIGIHVLDHGGRVPMSMEACQHGSILEEVHLHSIEIIITSSHHNTHRSTVQYSTVHQYTSTTVRRPSCVLPVLDRLLVYSILLSTCPKERG